MWNLGTSQCACTTVNQTSKDWSKSIIHSPYNLSIICELVIVCMRALAPVSTIIIPTPCKYPFLNWPLIAKTIYVVLHLLVHIWEWIWDNIHRDLEAHICHISQSLNHDTGRSSYTIIWPTVTEKIHEFECANSVTAVSIVLWERWRRIPPGSRSAWTWRIDNSRWDWHVVVLHLLYNRRRTAVWSNDVPDLDSTYGVALDQWKGRKQIAIISSTSTAESGGRRH